jgi:hypothetical protein
MLGSIIYRFRHWLFQWNAENEEDSGSIVFTVCGFIHFLKYKEHTIIYLGQGRKSDGFMFYVQPARSYVEAYRDEDNQ